MGQIRVELSGEGNLLELLRQRGIYLAADCGKKGRCGKCRIRFADWDSANQDSVSAPTEREREVLKEEELRQGWRLACLTSISGTVALDLENTIQEEEIATETDFYGAPGRENNSIKIQGEEKASYDRSREKGKRGERKVPSKNDLGDRGRTVIALDIGTTTLAGARIDGQSGKPARTATSVNHQRIYGADVISRIEASVRGEGEQLQRLILDDLAAMAKKLGTDLEEAFLVVSGNTTMEHLLQGYPCHTLGTAPYLPVDLSAHTFRNMLILPGISAFVGADIVSGIVSCGMDLGDKTSLLVDLGTNGEMAIGNRERLLCTSTAAGPAFEGGSISCGVAGVPGAISSVEIVGTTPHVSTIGGKEPLGLCGTGVLEASYELRKAGLIDETGLLDESYFQEGYPLAPSVLFTAKDIREVQLAKAAIRAGIEVLVRSFGIGYGEIDRVYLAGGFGQKVNVGKAVGIGLIPAELLGKVTAVGNSSLAGAAMAAKNPSLVGRFEEAAARAQEILLSENELFHDLYLDYMFFPGEE